jgi:hypothetical protein
MRRKMSRVSEDKWRQTGWYHRAKGSRDLFSFVGSLGGYSSNSRIAWRGMASSDFDLVSSLQRVPGNDTEPRLRQAELTILEAAREWGLGFGPGGWMTDLHLLADLQHYGTSTRLIDVTSNPMTALWFACQDPRDAGDVAGDGVLLAINTATWSRYGRARQPLTYSAQDDPQGWELSSALQNEQPFVVESLVPNDRLRAQEGFFLAGKIPDTLQPGDPFTSLQIPFQRTDPELLRQRLRARSSSRVGPTDQFPFVAVLIPQELKERVRVRLENSYNRRAAVLFPDFAGFRDFTRAAVAREEILDKRP